MSFKQWLESAVRQGTSRWVDPTLIGLTARQRRQTRDRHRARWVGLEPLESRVLLTAAPTITGLAPFDDTGASNSDRITSINTGLLINGTAQANTTITLFSGTTLQGGATTNGSGNWTVNIGTRLADNTYNIAVSGMTSSGTVTASIAAGVAHDANNTANAASTSTDNTVTFNKPADTITATAEITSERLAFPGISVGDPQAPQDGYTITLHNTGNTPIGTFWYAWAPGKDFMPDQPVNIVSPSGWTAEVFNSGLDDGYSLQWTATTPDADLAPGDSLTTFGFQNSTSPAKMAGESPFYPGTLVNESFVYIGAPEQDPGFTFAVTDQDPRTGPPVSVAPATGQSSPTSSLTINFAVDFTDAVTGFTNAGLSFAGSTAGGTLVGTVTGSGNDYNVAVTGMTTSGTVVLTIPAGVAHDNADNPNSASTSTDNSVTFTEPESLPEVSITATDPNASESTQAPGEFTVTRTGSTDAALQVLYTVAGSATPGTDYAALPGSVTILAGQASATITVTPIDAHVIGGSKDATLTLSANANYSIGGDSDTVTIADDDVPPQPNLTVQFGPDQIIAAPLVPGDANTLTGTITNSGTAAATGPIQVGVYLLPAAQDLPDVNDTPIGTAIIKGNLAAGLVAPWKIKTTVPGNLAGGSYHLVAVVDPNNAIVESNENDNSATLAPMMLDLEFGNIEGHKTVKTITIDHITYTYSGPGFGEVTLGQGGQPDSIQITGSTTATTLTAKPPKNTPTTIGDITITGPADADSVKTLDFTGITLGGDVSVPGLLATLKFGDTPAAGDHTITVSGNDPANHATLSLTAGSVKDLSVNSTIPIKAITVADWDDTDATPDVITALSIGTITSKADFGADVTVTNANPALKASLTSVSVKGVLGSIIRSAGSIGSITAGRIVDSVILVATTDPDLDGLPTTSADFVASNAPNSAASVVKVTAMGIKTGAEAGASFVNSVIAAPNVGTVTLKDVATDNGGTQFGIAAHLIKSVSRTGKVTVKNLSTLGDNDVDGDFVLRIV